MFRIFLTLISTVLFLSSCSIHEEINLSEEGKGYYKMSVDMSQAIEMMKGMGGKEQMPDSIANKVLDSSFSMSAQIDSVGLDFTDAEKKFFYFGTTHIQMNMKQNMMKMDLKYPIANAKELQQFFIVYAKVDSVSKLKQKENPEVNKDPTDMAISPDLFSALPANNKPYIITDTSIERIVVSKEDLTKQMGDMQGGEMFMSQMSYAITITLPRSVKRIEGKTVKLQDDKKTVLISLSFADMMSNPADGGFKIIF
jgi:hypothetical protein